MGTGSGNEPLKDDGQKSSIETPARTDWAPFPREIGESFTLREYVSDREASLCFDERSYGWTNWSATLDSMLGMHSALMALLCFLVVIIGSTAFVIVSTTDAEILAVLFPKYLDHVNPLLLFPPKIQRLRILRALFTYSAIPKIPTKFGVTFKFPSCSLIG